MRLHDWEHRLTRYVTEVACTGFAHGAHDCALFAAGAVAAVTGIDPGARWRGHYSSFKGGLKLVRKAGFTDHVAVMRQHCPQVHAASVMPGDLAVIGTGPDAALGVVQGALIYVLRETGLGLMPLGAANEYLGVR